MKELKRKLKPWTSEVQSNGDYDVRNEKGQNVADVFTDTDHGFGFFPSKEDSEFNQKLITKAPMLLGGLIEAYEAMQDGGIQKESIGLLIKSFEDEA